MNKAICPMFAGWKFKKMWWFFLLFNFSCCCFLIINFSLEYCMLVSVWNHCCLLVYSIQKNGSKRPRIFPEILSHKVLGKSSEVPLNGVRPLEKGYINPLVSNTPFFYCLTISKNRTINWQNFEISGNMFLAKIF